MELLSGEGRFFWLLKRQCLAYKKMFGFLSVFGDPGPLLNGDGCIKYPDMSSDLGIFEKFDRKIQNRALGWMSGTRKWLPVT